MTFDDLSEEQMLELKQRILTERNEQRGEGTSYGELADADDLVSDEDAKDWAEGMEFSPDDFSCSAGAPSERAVDSFWVVGYEDGDGLRLRQTRETARRETWWTPDVEYADKFSTKEAAKDAADRTPPPDGKRLSAWLVRTTALKEDR